MTADVILGCLIVWGLFLANAPFLISRWLIIGPRKSTRFQNHFGWLIPELLLGFGLFLLGGSVAESYQGQRHPQGWEFYVVTACLFLTFAFPGFVWRFLKRS